MARTVQNHSRTTVKPASAAPEKVDPYFSRAVCKALQALDYLSDVGAPASLVALAANLELTKASTFRILHTLEALGYISKDANSRFSLAGARQPQASARLAYQMLQAAATPLENLAMAVRETVSLAAVFENHIEVISVIESPQMMRMSNTVGRILPPHASSMGKAVTAFQRPETREKLIRSYGTPALTEFTVIDELALRNEYAQIEKRGYAEDREETIIGGRCFAAPIVRPNGIAVGAVSLSMPKMRLESPEQAEDIIRSVRQTAGVIAANLFE